MSELIPTDKYNDMIRLLDFGASTAEKDHLLDQAMIKTSAFSELLLDQIDLIRGCKGSGKTALFKLFSYTWKDNLYNEDKILIINGSEEPNGDPIFNYYYDRFEAFDENNFINFWKLYFLYLLNENILQSKKYSEELKVAKPEIDNFKRACKEANIPFLSKEVTLLTMLNKVFEALRSIGKLEGGMKADGSLTGGIVFKDTDNSTKHEKSSAAPIFISPQLAILKRILQKAGIRAWVMLDRLDEVFPRRSEVEIKALRSLLKCSNSFNDETLRLKIFLRDDIFEAVTEAASGFTALTHVTDRCSNNLRWGKDQILHLIVKRVLANDAVKKFYRPNMQQIEKDQTHRHEVFYKMFPKQMRSGKSQPHTLDWIYNRCEDGNGVVAPRDVIDLFRAAKRKQEEIFTAQPRDQQWLLSSDAINHGFIEMSEKKKMSSLKLSLIMCQMILMPLRMVKQNTMRRHYVSS